MANIYILIVLFSLTMNPAKAIFGWGNNDNQPQQQQTTQPIPPVIQPVPRYPQPNYRNYGGRGTVTGLVRRFPRRFDRQTLINSGPGLLQETFLLFNRFGNKSPQQQQAPQVQQNPNPQQILPIPQTQNTPEIPEVLEPTPVENIPGNNSEPLMLPAPKPGYIIRYNQERGVYEEVRELQIKPIQTIEE